MGITPLAVLPVYPAILDFVTELAKLGNALRKVLDAVGQNSVTRAKAVAGLKLLENPSVLRVFTH